MTSSSTSPSHSSPLHTAPQGVKRNVAGREQQGCHATTSRDWTTPFPLSNNFQEMQFSTSADVGEDDEKEEDRLLSFDYNALPTFPLRPSYKDNVEMGHLSIHIVNFQSLTTDPFRPTSVPIYQTATFSQTLD